VMCYLPWSSDLFDCFISPWFSYYSYVQDPTSVSCSISYSNFDYCFFCCVCAGGWCLKIFSSYSVLKSRVPQIHISNPAPEHFQNNLAPESRRALFSIPIVVCLVSLRIESWTLIPKPLSSDPPCNAHVAPEL
jgi:hypothetical protein